MYEYGARNYDPAVGRFFSIDNYAESFLDLTPYQYAGNNPVYFIDKNGEYIYIWDEGKGYKFDGGKLFGKDENGNWAVHTPEAGSFLDQVYTGLKQMYEFDTGADSGGSGDSFSNWFLNLFNNDNINANIKKEFARKGKDKRGAFHDNGYIYLDLEITKKIKAFTENGRFEKMDLFLIVAHELAHALSYNVISKDVRQKEWFVTEKERVSIDEIFAVGMENYLRGERNLPLRTHYIGPNNDPSLFEKSRIYNKNKETGQFEMTTAALQIFNNYKKSIQQIGIQWKD